MDTSSDGHWYERVLIWKLEVSWSGEMRASPPATASTWEGSGSGLLKGGFGKLPCSLHLTFDLLNDTFPAHAQGDGTQSLDFELSLDGAGYRISSTGMGSVAAHGFQTDNAITLKKVPLDVDLSVPGPDFGKLAEFGPRQQFPRDAGSVSGSFSIPGVCSVRWTLTPMTVDRKSVV